MGSGKILALILAMAMPSALAAKTHSNDVKRAKRWPASLRKSLARIEKAYPGQLGLFVKDLSTGESFSWRADQSWYLASGVKVPVAIEVLQRIDRGELSMSSEIELGESDYVDGAGETNSHPPGTKLSVHYLFEQMLIHSDNTATDLLIRQVGLSRVNRTLKSWVPRGFSRITTLSEVRRRAYSGLHPRAIELRNQDFIRLKSIRHEKGKRSEFARLLGIDESSFVRSRLDEAYESYYKTRLNSGTLRAYGELLERIFEGERLSHTSRRTLIDALTRVETGARRVKAALPAGTVFAHKTGTQHRRICDLGVAWPQENSGRRIVIAACASGFSSLFRAEGAMRKLGRAVTDSGVFLAEP